MSDISANDFNYSSVDADTASKLEYFAKRGKALMRKSQIQFIAEFGQVLSEARTAISHHGDGLFIKWATAEFDIGKSTVYNYVNAWDKCLSNGWTNYQHWTQTALYLASADDFPKPAMKKLEKIPATDLVRASDVKRLMEAAKPKPITLPEARDLALRTMQDADESRDSANKDSSGDEQAAEEASTDSPEFADDTEQLPEDETMEQVCHRETSEIESWAHKFGDMLKEAQKDLSAVPTLDELNARDGWERKMKESLATLRGTKPVVCPICQGDGAEKCPCRGHGRVTKQQHGQMV